MLQTSHLDPHWLAALEIISSKAEKLGVPFMVIGASARDILLSESGMLPERATRDVDLAIELATWLDFEKLKAALVSNDAFQYGRESQRIIFSNSLPIDLVPYGAIAQGSSEICWPPDHAVHMSVTGLKDVYDASLSLVLAERSSPHVIHVASAVGLVLLKILAWEDRKLATTKDAKDLFFLIKHYIDLGNLERLATDHNDLFDDIDTASARLLGRDLLGLCGEESLSAIKVIIEREVTCTNESRLVRDMLPRGAGKMQQKYCQQILIAIQTEIY